MKLEEVISKTSKEVNEIEMFILAKESLRHQDIIFIYSTHVECAVKWAKLWK